MKRQYPDRLTWSQGNTLYHYISAIVCAPIIRTPIHREKHGIVSWSATYRICSEYFHIKGSISLVEINRLAEENECQK